MIVPWDENAHGHFFLPVCMDRVSFTHTRNHRTGGLNMEYEDVEKFREWLISEEKSRATVDKYMRDIKKCWETIGKD